MVHIDDFPDKVIFEILSHLDKDSFLAAAEVCMKWNRVISENIEFFSSYFQDEDDEQETADATESDAKAYEKEQEAMVAQILSFKPNQFYEMLGVSPAAEEEEVRTQYKKLALMVHPDKCKAPGAVKAFQALKRAFECILNGVDPDAKDTCKFECPNPSCGSTVYVSAEKNQLLLKGWDITFCKVCKQKIGRVFCTHCFAAWMMVIEPEKAGSLFKCTACNKQFAIQYPKPAPPARAKPPEPKKRVVKKRKVNWWEAPS